MGRRAVLERVEHEAELLPRLFQRQADGLEDLFLQFAVVDTQAAAADLDAVQHHIVSDGLDAARVGGEVLHVLVARRGERMVHRLPALFLVAVLEHREVDDPEEAELVRIDQVPAAAHLETQRAEGLRQHQRLVRDDQQQVAGLRAALLLDLLKDFVGIEFLERRLDSLRRILDPSHALRAVALHIFDKAVELAARDVGVVVDLDGLDLAARFEDGGEDLEGRAFDFFGNIEKLHAEAHIRLVRAEALHRLVPRHAQERRFELHTEGLIEQLRHQAFHHGQDRILVDEGHLDIELGEFRLTVGAQILVAEAADDLEIFLEARHHQNLLVDLRRLRQRVEIAGVQAARHEEVPGALRRALAEHRRLDFEESEAVEIVAHDFRHAMAQHDILLHLGTTQVEIAVFETQHLVHVEIVLDIERRRLRLVQDAKLAADDLDLARFHLRVHGVLGARAHVAAHRDDELRAQGLRLVERALAHLRLVVNHLHIAGTVTQIDKNQSAVVAAARHPAAYRDFLPDLALAKLSAMMRPFHTFQCFHYSFTSAHSLLIISSLATCS